MRTLIFGCLLTTAALAQSGKLGIFTNSGDIGDPSMKGSTEYDAAKKEYKLTGAGDNIWAKVDQFQYVWKEMSGNMAVTATMQFVGEGLTHRKAGIMLRKSLDTDSPYVDVVIHGTGMPAIQWRNTKGDTTNGVDFPFDSPGKFKLKLVRTAAQVAVSIGKDGAELKPLGTTTMPIGSPVYVGLAVCSHKKDKSETVIFSDVTIEELPTPPMGKKKQP